MSRWPSPPPRLPVALLSLCAALSPACAPPPLPGADGTTAPTIRFVFPETGHDAVLCPDILVVVDVENWDMIDPDETDGSPVPGQGHWHLKEYDAYVDFSSREWLPLTIDTSNDASDPQPHVLEAVLASSDHNELDTEVYPSSQATTEFLVSPTNCEIGSLGGGDE